MNRREFIRKSSTYAAAVTTGGFAAMHAKAEPKEPAYAGPHEATNALKSSGVSFVYADGSAVNLDALGAKLKGHVSTVSSMFAACPMVCPKTTGALKLLSDQDASMRHLVISVVPEDDFYGRESKTGRTLTLTQKLESQGMKTSIGGNTTIIFPLGEGKNLHEKLQNGLEACAKAQHAVDMSTMGKDAGGHSPEVLLYARSGKYVKRVVGNTSKEIVDKLDVKGQQL